MQASYCGRFVSHEYIISDVLWQDCRVLNRSSRIAAHFKRETEQCDVEQQLGPADKRRRLKEEKIFAIYLFKLFSKNSRKRIRVPQYSAIKSEQESKR